MHVLILGQTGSGKTTLGTSLVREYGRIPRLSMILDPFRDSRWESQWIYSDIGAFMQDARKARSMALFVDESGSVVGQYERENHWLATEARHWGHRTHFLAQRAAQVAPTVRYQCSNLALFRVSHSDAAELAKDWSTEGIETASDLRRGEFLWIDRFGGMRRFAIDFPTGIYKPLDKVRATDESSTRATTRRSASRDRDRSASQTQAGEGTSQAAAKTDSSGEGRG